MQSVWAHLLLITLSWSYSPVYGSGHCPLLSWFVFDYFAATAQRPSLGFHSLLLFTCAAEILMPFDPLAWFSTVFCSVRVEPVTTASITPLLLKGMGIGSDLPSLLDTCSWLLSQKVLEHGCAFWLVTPFVFPSGWNVIVYLGWYYACCTLCLSSSCPWAMALQTMTVSKRYITLTWNPHTKSHGSSWVSLKFAWCCPLWQDDVAYWPA